MRTWGPKLAAALVAVLAATVLPAFAADPPPSITVTADRNVYVAGHTATITVVVSGAGSGKYLRMTMNPVEGDPIVVTSAAYDDTFHRSFAMYVDSALTTELLDSDGTTVLATDQKVFPVQAAVSSMIGGYYQRSGSYAIFAPGTEPVFRSGTYPPHSGRCIKHEVWRQFASGWKPILLSTCRWENAQGTVTWRWTGNHGSGVNFRVRAKFFGDKLNHANAGRFIYFRFN